MRRFSHIIVCALAFAFCLAALPMVSRAQVRADLFNSPSLSGQPRTTAAASPSVATPGAVIPEGTTVVYSNFGPGDSYYCCEIWVETGLDNGVWSPFIQGMGFTPRKATYILKQLDLALSYDGVGTNGVTVELLGDMDGLPGKVIYSWFVSGLPASFSSTTLVQTLKVNKTILLIQNRQYWLVAWPNLDEFAGWQFNSLGITGPLARSIDGGETWTAYTGYTNGAFDVLGTVLPQTSGQ